MSCKYSVRKSTSLSVLRSNETINSFVRNVLGIWNRCPRCIKIIDSNIVSDKTTRIEVMRILLLANFSNRLFCRYSSILPSKKLGVYLSEWALQFCRDHRIGEDMYFAKRKLNRSYPANRLLIFKMGTYQIDISSDLSDFHTIVYQFLHWKETNGQGDYPDLSKILRYTETIKINLCIHSSNLWNKDNEDMEMFLSFNEHILVLRKSLFDILQRYYNGEEENRMNRCLQMLLCNRSLLIHNNSLSITDSMAEVLIREFNVTVEGFASPINSKFMFLGKSYCSLFGEVDRYYGSRGSFYNQKFINEGIFANPPYIENDVVETCMKILYDCQRISETSDSILYVLNIPIWNDLEIVKDLLESSFLIRMYYVHSFEYMNNNTGTKIPTNSTKIFAFFSVNWEISSEAWKAFEFHLNSYLEEEVPSGFVLYSNASIPKEKIFDLAPSQTRE